MVFTKKQLKIFVSILGLVLAVLLLRQNNLFLSISGYSYDLLGRWSPGIQSKQSAVTLVSVPVRDSLMVQQWTQLIQDIMQQQPKALIVRLDSSQLDSQLLSTLKISLQAWPDLYFLLYLQTDPEQENQYLLPQAKKMLEQAGFNTLLSAYPMSENGIYRYQWRILPYQKQQIYNYDFVVSMQHKGITENDDPKFLVNFLSGVNQIPVIKSQRILTDQLLPELIQDKYVLLGVVSDISLHGLITPLGDNARKLSLLEFQGYALDSVVQKKWIIEPGSWLLAIILIVQIIISLLLYQWNRRYISLLITNTLVMFYILLSWYLLHFHLIRLPLVELIVVQFILHVAVQRFQAVHEEDELQDTLLAISAKTQERVIPVSFYQSEDPWSQIVVLINQTLNLNRLIFLERIPEDHRVKEIKALNCNIDDIHEMRRDYERIPYSTAIEAKAPIRINTEKRTFLKNTEENEEQYLVPLVFGNEILGFWALGISQSQLSESSSFIQHISDYGRQISELLYYRHRFQDEQQNTSLLQRYLKISTQHSTQQLLNETVEVLNHRLDSLESVFHGISSSTILYDLFGRVVQMNSQMEKFIYDRQIPAYEMTALDFIYHTTGMEIAKVRHIIEQVIIEQRQFTIPLIAEENEEHYYILIAKPLKASTEDEFSEVMDSTPFQVIGVLIELNDLSELKENIAIKEKINEYMLYKLKNNLESLVLATDLLSEETMEGEERNEIEQLMHAKVNETSNMINQFDQYLHSDNNMLTFEMYPVDIIQIIKQVSALLMREGIRDNINISEPESQVMVLVIAEINTLKGILRLLIKILINDAIESSTIGIEIQDDENNIYIQLFNEGFGMPNSEFQDYLYSEDALVSKEFVKLKSYMQVVKKWGGDIQAHSNIGEGINFTLILKKVL